MDPKLKHPLTKEQEQDVEWALKHPYSILGMRMGTGKTPVSIAIKSRIRGSRCLVVAPSYLLLNWVKEIHKFLPNQIVARMNEGRKIYYPLDDDFVIISYDLVKKADFLFKWATMVILDEGHLLKNPESDRGYCIHKAVFESNVKRLHILTGTPVQNRVPEFYSLISLCHYDPRRTKSTFLEKFPTLEAFSDHFAKKLTNTIDYAPGKSRKVKSYYGIKNKEELKGWLKDIYRTRKLDMPLPIIKRVWVSDKVDSEVEDFVEENSIWDGRIPPSISLIKMKNAIAKVPTTISYIEDLLKEGVGKVVVYSDHVEPCEMIAKHFKVRPIHGGVSNREQIVEDFKRPDGPMVLSATMGSLNSGQTLTVSWNMVINDFCWVPGILDQVEGRINRLTQTRQPVIHYVLGSSTDDKILEKLNEKRKVIYVFSEEMSAKT